MHTLIGINIGSWTLEITLRHWINDGLMALFTIPATIRNVLVKTSGISCSVLMPGKSIMINDKLHAVVQTVEKGVHSVEAPLQRLEHAWHMLVSYMVIAIFALANAGISLEFPALGEVLAHPVTLGASLGLVLGKFSGITGVCWLMLKPDVAVLPKDTRFS